ncbi:MAG TPA: hypothetical protein VGC26_01370 [Afipia sp.]
MASAACAMFLAAAPPARAAGDLPYVYIPPIDVDVNVDVDLGRRHPPRYYDPRGVYAGIPPGHYEREIDRPLVAPDQVAAMLRSTGFSLLGPINRRGWVYTVAVLDPRGDDGRVIIDARTGAIIRFLPAFAINGRTDQELSVLYGPPGPPPGVPPISQDMRRAPRPSMNVPKVASRTPSALPQPRPQPSAKAGTPAGQAVDKPSPSGPPAEQSASVQSKPAETAPEVAKPVEAKPAANTVPAKPAEVELKPTQEMPPMQTLE